MLPIVFYLLGWTWTLFVMGASLAFPACMDCQKLFNRAQLAECPMEYSDCGNCLPGFEAEEHTNGRWSEVCQQSAVNLSPPIDQGNFPSSNPGGHPMSWMSISAILIVSVAVIVFAVVMLTRRAFSFRPELPSQLPKSQDLGPGNGHLSSNSLLTPVGQSCRESTVFDDSADAPEVVDASVGHYSFHHKSPEIDRLVGAVPLDDTLDLARQHLADGEQDIGNLSPSIAEGVADMPPGYDSGLGGGDASSEGDSASTAVVGDDDSRDEEDEAGEAHLHDDDDVNDGADDDFGPGPSGRGSRARHASTSTRASSAPPSISSVFAPSPFYLSSSNSSMSHSSLSIGSSEVGPSHSVSSPPSPDRRSQPRSSRRRRMSVSDGEDTIVIVKNHIELSIRQSKRRRTQFHEEDNEEFL